MSNGLPLCIALMAPGVKGVGLSGRCRVTCSAEDLEGRLRRTRENIYSAQRFSGRQGWNGERRIKEGIKRVEWTV